jgi:hypothetical protein
MVMIVMADVMMEQGLAILMISVKDECRDGNKPPLSFRSAFGSEPLDLARPSDDGHCQGSRATDPIVHYSKGIL